MVLISDATMKNLMSSALQPSICEHTHSGCQGCGTLATAYKNLLFNNSLLIGARIHGGCRGEDRRDTDRERKKQTLNKLSQSAYFLMTEHEGLRRNKENQSAEKGDKME